MHDATRDFVRARASYRCEYCQIHETDDIYVLHVEHIIPRKHGGGDTVSNLALACHQCNFHRGSNLTGIDPDTEQIIQLFNPREQQWLHHFRYDGAELVGLTPVGRTTVRVMCINDSDRVQMRKTLG